MQTKFIQVLLFLVVSTTVIAQRANQNQNEKRKIQVAILFDTSGSMNGLLNQAKTRIWGIINTLTTFRYNGENPAFEFALYDYGNSTIPATDNYVRQITPFTTDLDLISSKLFGLSTNGGQEYCAAVIETSLDDLEWSKDNRDMKLIYIAGNEPFNQGPIDYKLILKKAKNNGVFVNTIYCGPYEQGVKDLWYDGSLLSDGKYLNIDQNKQIEIAKTPYDDSIRVLNDRLNKTYISFGTEGKLKKMDQIQQDSNALSASPSSSLERTISKSSKAYKNSSWDLVDYVSNQEDAFDHISDQDLPVELMGKSKEEKEEFVLKLTNERSAVQLQISNLAQLRKSFIELEMKNSEVKDDFGNAVTNSLIELGLKMNYTQ